MKIKTDEAIKEMQFLADGYKGMNGCEKLHDACNLAILALRDNPDEIEWNNAKYETYSKIGQTIMLGFSCSNCGAFSQVKSRFCRECGGRYDGSVKKDVADANNFNFGGF